MGKPNVLNVQKYCIHDGDGIRTTIFFKGCALACQWCHNPESQAFGRQLMFFADRCTGCGACVSACPRGCVALEGGLARTDLARCAACGACADPCLRDARAVMGEEYTVERLVELAGQDRMFYETSGGGVTLSGGEVMLQDEAFLLELLRRLDRKGYPVTIDTCGYAPWERFERALPYVECFLYDVKLMDSARHRAFTGQGNELILENLRRLSAAGAKIYIRVPVVEGVNATDEEARAMAGWLRANTTAERVYLLPYHSTGRDKYARMGLEERGSGFRAPSDGRMRELAGVFRAAGFPFVQIGG